MYTHLPPYLPPMPLGPRPFMAPPGLQKSCQFPGTASCQIPASELFFSNSNLHFRLWFGLRYRVNMYDGLVNTINLSFIYIKEKEVSPLFRLSISGCCCLGGTCSPLFIYRCCTIRIVSNHSPASSPTHPSPNVYSVFLCLGCLSMYLQF